MAAEIFQHGHEISRQEIQAAVAKAVELRAIHAALLQGNSPANLRHQSSPSPSILRSSNQFSAQDYPVFMPSYEEEPLPGSHHIQPDDGGLSEMWDEGELERGEYDDEANLSGRKTAILSSRRRFSSSLVGREQPHVLPVEDHKLKTGSCANHITVLQTSPDMEIQKSSRRTRSGDFYISSKNHKNSNTVVPVTDSHPSIHAHQPKNRGQILSWLFPRLKKKPKIQTSLNVVEYEDAPQFLKEWGMLSLESLKKELLEANENRDAALMEASEMRSSLGELKQKLVHLETYCDELKKALKQAVHGKDAQVPERPNLSKRGKSIDGGRDSAMPVSHEVMVEGFLQIVSEARLSVKQFCKTLINQVEETDGNLLEKLNLILQPHNLTLHSKHSKWGQYHLEGMINQALHQDFENCIFQKNGSQKVLDPHQDRQAKFSAFVALRNLSWNEVLRKGTKYYSEEFSRFCDQKMSCIISALDWSRPWPEQLLQSFFVAAKCIWLLHLLSFSFSPPLAILRVDENTSFDPVYMEDMLFERQQSQAPARVKIMVMPGFYVEDKVLRCKVLCRYKNAG
ncbi:IRK-interacting protein-like [Magnolia sinica]|uniref:IRK-interacting protein-like n=1 Tax=Magnolia sinica TaxID=86752 RepID=UPI002657BB87|nr:IRK-interacting protein-like [Magnolia sinica]